MRRALTAVGILACLLSAAVALPPQSVRPGSGAARASAPRFQVLAFYSRRGEPDHVAFNLQAVRFFRALAKRDSFGFAATTHWSELSPAVLSKYQVVIWLNGSPARAAERLAFENYMRHGGAWLGFHGAGYQPSRQAWPWYADFLGGVFSGNSWPPLPAKLLVSPRNDATGRSLLAGLPASYQAPSNEWYSWEPDPRTQPGIEVWLTLAPSNYPIGFKNTLERGDIPVAWTNTRYRMVYINMGHGDKIFTSPAQDRFIENALLWLGEARKAR